jgi:penicillin-insensitive murein endopeptidase
MSANRWLVLAVLAPVLFGTYGVARAGAKRELPDKYERSPYSLMSLSVGHPNDGWQVRAKRLRSRAEIKVRAKSVDRNYGHPALVLMLRRSAADVAKAVPGSVMVVGDLSTKTGGAIGGHRSHQSGRDADIAFYMRDAKDRPVVPPSFVAFDGEGHARDGSGLTFDDRRNWLLVQSWARDRRAGLSHIFISSPLRKRLLAFANRYPEFRKYRGEAAALLKQPEAGEDHSDHFHVRISCPKRQAEICREHSR